MHKIKQRVLLPNAIIGDTQQVEPALPAPSNSLPLYTYGVPLLKARFILDGAVISLAAANDYGSIQLCDLPNKNLLIAGALVDATVTVAGAAVNQGDAVDWALGTAALASTDFSNGGEANIIDEYNGTGAGATGAANAHSFDNSSPALIFLDAAGTNDIFLNAQTAVTTGTGTLTFGAGSFVDLFYFDLGEPA